MTELPAFLSGFCTARQSVISRTNVTFGAYKRPLQTQCRQAVLNLQMSQHVPNLMLMIFLEKVVGFIV